MSTPKQKRTKSSKRKKQYHLRLKPLFISHCPKCKKPILPHNACRFCGEYNGKEIFKVKQKRKDKDKSKTKDKVNRKNKSENKSVKNKNY